MERRRRRRRRRRKRIVFFSMNWSLFVMCLSIERECKGRFIRKSRE
ncbi:hypothetical protein ACMBCN_01545 [Candidatus Liberibacter asiaticus]|nr:hypothetical protein [Candidatus Liberibacter asiaticus]